MKTQSACLKVFFVTLFAFTMVFLGTTGHTRAQTQAVPQPCIALSGNLWIGVSDVSANNISTLQTFLYNRGYMAHAPTGYFGPITYAAVVKFQLANGIPGTGFVGPLTRAKIQELTCITPTPPSASVSITSISPAIGPVGTTVTLKGTGFTADNTIMFAGGAISHVSAGPRVIVDCFAPTCTGSSTFQTLTFAIPSSIGPYCPVGSYCALYLQEITPGTYPVSVMNMNGTSNSVNFTVTANTIGGSLSITGIDAPNSLSAGASGTWTVHVTGPQAETLNYSVSWGDQMSGQNAVIAPQPASVQSSATFTHAYGIAGTYAPVFTVTDNFGHAATASATVIVSPLY